MASIVINGDTSGSVSITATPVAGSNTVTLPALSGTAVLDTATQTLTNKTLDSTNTVSASLVSPSFNSAPVPTVSGTAPIYFPRAWVTFDATAAGTFAGGVSTVTRIAASTTATITTTNPHGLTTSNVIWALTGVAAGLYSVTVTSTTQFTITTVATTALNAVAITFQFLNILGSGNVNSVVKQATGKYYVNLTTPLPDAYGITVGSATSTTSLINANPLTAGSDGSSGPAYQNSVASFGLSSNSCGAGGNSLNDLNRNYAAIIR